MIHPAPTTPIDPKMARGVLVAGVPASATKPAMVRVTFPNTSYELHLHVDPSELSRLPAPGKRLVGAITGKARRIDVVTTGGRYVEPVFGHPRRVQGRIVDVDAGANVLTVDAGMPLQVTPTDTRQKAGDFKVGQFVSFDAQEGTGFRVGQ